MGYVPVNIHTVENSTYSSVISKQAKLGILANVLNTAPPTAITTFFPNSTGIDTVIVDEMLKFAEQKQNVDETTESILSGCKAVLDEYYRANPITK